jgi:hypothetical protein
MLIKKTLKTPVYWIIVAVFFGCIGKILTIAPYQVESMESLYLLDDISSILSLLAFGCGFIAIALLVKTKKIRKVSGVIQILVLVFVGYSLEVLESHEFDYYRDAKGNKEISLDRLMHLKVELNEYTSSNKKFPDANSWSDSFFVNNIHRVDILTYYAFNKNLGNASIEQLPGNVVLLVEYEGGLNSNGADELLTPMLERHKYLLFPSQRYNYILFVDGTIVKYRRSDGAISKYGEHFEDFPYDAIYKSYKSFGLFQKQGTTPYSPLKWK